MQQDDLPNTFAWVVSIHPYIHPVNGNGNHFLLVCQTTHKWTNIHQEIGASFANTIGCISHNHPELETFNGNISCNQSVLVICKDKIHNHIKAAFNLQRNPSAAVAADCWKDHKVALQYSTVLCASEVSLLHCSIIYGEVREFNKYTGLDSSFPSRSNWQGLKSFWPTYLFSVDNDLGIIGGWGCQLLVS